MKHSFVQAMAYCQHCHLTFANWREFGEVCPGQLVDEPRPIAVPEPTPLPPGVQPAAQPGPRVMYAIHQALEGIIEHYDPLPQIGAADSDINVIYIERQRQIRLVARSLCRSAGCDPDAVVIQPGVLPKTPKGAFLIGFHLHNAVPYWCLYLNDARIALEAAEAAAQGKELSDGREQFREPAQEVERVGAPPRPPSRRRQGP